MPGPDDPRGLAIVGIGLAVDGCCEVASLDRAIYTLERPRGPLAEAGAPDCLIEQVVERALADAGLEARRDLPIVACTDEVRRAAQHQGWRVGCADDGPLGGLSTAARLLADPNASVAAAVLVAAELERDAAAHTPPGEATLSFDRRAWGAARAAGVIGLVVRAAAAVPGRTPYATVAAVAGAETLDVAMRSALARGALAPGEVGYVEAWASGLPAEDDAEVAALTEVYANLPPSCALGSIKCTLGNLGAAAGLAGIVRACLSLRGRYLPGTPHWTGPREPDRWHPTALYVPSDSRPWIIHPQARRIAGVNAFDANGWSTHLLLAEPPTTRPVAPCARLEPLKTLYLLPLAAASAPDLLEYVRRAEDRLAQGEPPARLAQQLSAGAQPEAPLAVAIIGQNPDQLRRELQAAVRAIPVALDTGADWLTPGGSCFAPRPLGPRSSVAFVYPGAFSSYPRLAREAFRLFPWLWEPLTEAAGDLERALAPRLLYARRLEKPTARELAAEDAALAEDAVAMMSSGMVGALLYTLIARDCFGVQPQVALGYSFGELSMLAALGVWPDAVRSTPARTSELFRTRLAGPKLAVREFWQATGVTPLASDDAGWSSYVVLAPAEVVRQAVMGQRTVFLTMVNSPDEVVVAGLDADCVRLLESHGWQSVRMPFSHAIHCPPIRSEREEFVRIAQLPTRNITEIRFYSAAEYAPLRLESDSLASALADMSCRTFDFARLVERVYADGAQVFVEVGAGGTCTRMIDACLGSRPHAAVSINRPRAAEQDTIARFAARLFSHRVRLDLAPLIEPAE